MGIRFANSARKHKIGKGRALEVIKSSIPTVIEESGREVWTWIGSDYRGLILEVIAIRESMDFVIIHVMPFQYRRRGHKDE